MSLLKLKQKIIRLSKVTFLAILLTSVVTQVCLAQQPNQQTNAVNNLVAGYGLNNITATNPSTNQPNPLALFFQSSDAVYNQLIGNAVIALLTAINGGQPLQPGQPPSSTVPIATNPSYTQGSATPPTLNSQAINNLMTTTNPNLTYGTLMNVPAPVPVSTPNTIYANGKLQQQSTTPTQSFDLSSLLGPVAYSTSGNPAQNTIAQNFITFASAQAMQMPVLDLSKLSQSQIQQAFNKKDVQAYFLALRSIVAQQSVGLGNLYYLYAERMPVSTRSIAQAMTLPQNSPLYPTASPMQVDQYLATRRFTDPNWITSIQTLDTPSELMRQQIYLLREINYEMYQNRLVNERIMAALSVLLLQNSSATSQVALQQLYNSAKSQPPFVPSSSTQQQLQPATPPPPPSQQQQQR